MIIRTIREQGIDELKRRILLNLEDLIKMIEWNDQNGIRVFRLSSELFPHKTNSKVEDYTFDFAKDHLKRVGECARMFDQRLTFHPGQYVVLSSPLEKNVKQSIKELDYHAKILELMGCDKNLLW